MKRTIVIFISTFDIDGFEKIREYKTRWKIFEEKLKIPLTNVFELDIIELSKAEKYIGKRNGTDKRELENWLKFLINPKVVEESKMEDVNEEIKKAYEIWQNIQLDEETRDAAERRFMELGSIEGAKEIERELGREEGRKEGRKESKIEIAKKMIDEKISIEVIAKVTGLSEEEIKKL